jgi:5-methylcytosine-specific restriction endonuclease McrA
MNTNALTLATRLSDEELLARLGALATTERETAAELVAHLAVLDARPSLYAAKGFGSLFGYCTQVLRLSEDATCTRIDIARVSRRFPRILELLASGAIPLTSLRLLCPHLTPENHETVLERARKRSRREIEALVAELAPRADVPSSVRKLPAVAARPAPVVATTATATREEAADDVSSEPLAGFATPPSAPPALAPPLAPTRRAIVEMTSPERYRVQFTIAKESHDKLRRVQALLRREIPDGDLAAIYDRALTLLLEKVERAKCGATARPAPARPAPARPAPARPAPARPAPARPSPARPSPARPAPEVPSPPQRLIRPGTDKVAWRQVIASRHIPRAVQRGVCQLDGDQCAFVSKDGRRCTETTFLEFHHRVPHAYGGAATIDNISLRCRRHNQYEAEVDFGPGAGRRAEGARNV